MTLPSFSSAFLRGDAAALGLLPDHFRQPAARQAAVHAAQTRAVSPVLLDLVRAQNAPLPASAAREQHLRWLAEPGVSVVVTGQQLGLFLGPLYTFYKAASAIAAARVLSHETGAHVVPLFWLQTEDHDFEEVRRCHLLAADDTPLELGLADDPAQARVSLAHRTLGPELPALLSTLSEAFSGLPYADECLALLQSCYRPGRTLRDAFAEVLGALFADEGLLLFDPRVDEAARLATPLFARVLTDHAGVTARLLARSRALQDGGFAEQVRVREEASLLFFHADGPSGPRQRLVCRDGGWSVAGSDARFDERALLDRIEREPLCFSTSALLRPLLQDWLWPTAAYVGGPGEINYLAQLGPLYAHLGLVQPMVVPRARFRLIDARSRRLLAALGVTPADVEQPEVLLRMVAEHAKQGARLTPEALRMRLEEPFGSEIDQLAPSLAPLHPHLARALVRTRATVARAIERLSERYRRVLAEHDGIASERATRLAQALMPAGIPQERRHGLWHVAARYGIGALKARVFAGLDPFAAAVRNLDL